MNRVLGAHYTIITIRNPPKPYSNLITTRNPQNPILVIEAPTLRSAEQGLKA